MPTTVRDPTTIPAIQMPPAFSANAETEEGAIRGLLEALHGTVVNIVQRMNGLLSVGTGVHGAWTGNLDGQWIRRVVFDGVSEVVIPHGLGRVPVGMIPVIVNFVPDDDTTTAPELIASDTNGWTQDMVYLKKLNAGKHTVSLLVF